MTPRADLTASTRLTDKGDRNTQAAVQQRLAHWQQERDLAALRDERALAALPAKDRDDRPFGAEDRTMPAPGSADVEDFPSNRLLPTGGAVLPASVPTACPGGRLPLSPQVLDFQATCGVSSDPACQPATPLRMCLPRRRSAHPGTPHRPDRS